jgi:hypothetical protein
MWNFLKLCVSSKLNLFFLSQRFSAKCFEHAKVDITLVPHIFPVQTLWYRFCSIDVNPRLSSQSVCSDVKALRSLSNWCKLSFTRHNRFSGISRSSLWRIKDSNQSCEGFLRMCFLVCVLNRKKRYWWRFSPKCFHWFCNKVSLVRVLSYRKMYRCCCCFLMYE